jgi:hypothetical protein
MPTPHRSLSVTLIRHPEIDEAAARRCLSRLADAAQRTWGEVDHQAVHQLSPGALTWRGAIAVKDADTPAARGTDLVRALESVRDLLRQSPLDEEAGRLLQRSRFIFTGHTGQGPHWGVTLTVQDTAPLTIEHQARSREPQVIVDSAALSVLVRDIQRAALSPRLPEAAIEEPVHRRSRRSP